MSEIRNIRERIRKIAGSGESVPCFTGEVTSVTDKDCSVMFGSLELTGVKLFSVDDAGTLLIKPSMGSMVTVLDLSNGQMRDLILVKCDKVQLIRFDQDGLKVEIDSVAGKVDIKNRVTSLTDLFSTVYDIISKLTVSTPNGPSGTPLPPTVVSLEKFKMDFQQLLK